MDPENDMCRVAVHAGAECVDLTLPAAVPLAVLLPRVCELVDRMCGTVPAARARRLCTPGADALDVSKTLLQNGIRDGDALVLTAARELEPPRVRRDPAAELAHATPADATCWDARTAGLLSAVVLLGAVGPTVLGGGPATPQLLLGASAAGGAAAVAARMGRPPTLFAGLAVGAGLTAAAALGGTFMDYDLQRTGVLLSVLAIAMLVGATRLALAIPGPADAVHRFSAIVHAAAGAAATGVALAAATGGPVECGLGAVASTVLTLRARAHRRPVQRWTLLLGGVFGAAVTLGSAARLEPSWGPWLCVAALGGGAAVVTVTQRSVTTPLLGEALTVAEYAGLAALLPLAGWSLGVFDVLGPTR